MVETKEFICENINEKEGNLVFAGYDVKKLSEKYGTPLYLCDEERIRERCRTYQNAVKEVLFEKGRVYYASKALSFKKIYEIMKSEDMCIDVVSCGEIYTAKSVGFPMENAIFHSNNKTDADIEYAMDCGIGSFVADNEEELYAVDRIAEEKGKIQPVLIRLTPGIDPHTFAAVSTGKVDSKFGSAIETGQAEEITKIAMSLKNVELKGFHCHVGSQIFETEVYFSAADKMLGFVKEMQEKYGFETEILDMGGGFGVRYKDDMPKIDIGENVKCVCRYIKSKAEDLNIKLPVICFEPGRSIVADAGMTVYKVGTVKRIPGYKNYVSVDGGMTDNVRFALYSAPYTLLPADNMKAERTMKASVVGRCCESGDIIQENVMLPETIGRDDLIACLTTGAYNYSMASNYNRIPRPPVVMLSRNGDKIAVRRETYEDVASLDL